MGDARVEKIQAEGATKPRPVEAVLHELRKILEYLLCVVTCGCFPGPQDELHTAQAAEAELMQDEREAVRNLLAYLDNINTKGVSINEERLRALCILSYSDNTDLQRSAALCFAELGERMQMPVTEIMVEPLVVLLRSRDPQVQKAASLAVSNFALNGPGENKEVLVNAGAMRPLIQLLEAEELEVQCNACGCVTTLATTDRGKSELVKADGISPLLQLAHSVDVRVQRNATGALLNLTHIQGNRDELVKLGALPMLVMVLTTPDPDVQYYCAAALSNLAVSERHRVMVMAVGHNDAIHKLTQLLSSAREKVKCQACLALRNLASDGDSQLLMVKMGCLSALHGVVRHSRADTLTAALACLRNLSIHKANEAGILKAAFLPELRRVLQTKNNWQAQMHAAGTIRNLAAGEHIQDIVSSGCVEALVSLMLSSATRGQVLVEVTAALAVLADEDITRSKLLQNHKNQVLPKVLELATSHTMPEVQYNSAGILGQLSLIDLPAPLIQHNLEGIESYLRLFLTHADPSYMHIALWTTVQLLRFDIFANYFRQSSLVSLVEEMGDFGHTDAVRELAKTVMKKIPAS